MQWPSGIHGSPPAQALSKGAPTWWPLRTEDHWYLAKRLDFGTKLQEEKVPGKTQREVDAPQPVLDSSSSSPDEAVVTAGVSSPG